MELKLGNFYVKDIVFGYETAYLSGVLTINKEEALSLIMSDERIIKCDIVVVRPGESVRLLPVKTAIEPRCKVTKGYAYPGQENPIEMVGEGTTHCLKGMSILTLGKYGGFSEGILDMGGEGAKYSHYSQYINVCLLMESTDENEEKKASLKKSFSYRTASYKLAEYLGNVVKELTPDEYETYNFEPVLKRNVDKKLPKIVYSLHMKSPALQSGMNTTIYGWDANKTLPMLISPTEILDTALGMTVMTVAACGETDMDYANNPTIKRLFKENGKTIDFVGVILTTSYSEMTEKKRSAQMVAQLCKTMGVDGVINCLASYSNAQIDFMYTLVALEDAGVKTVGTIMECCGKDGKSQPLILMDSKANAIVSGGNVSELVELPTLDTIYGDIESLIRDPWSGAWAKDDKYGPSLREDNSIIVEKNCIWMDCSPIGFSMKTVKEF